ncbi:hypothetical protein IW262DRAFT_1301741 [Armillaria fumosa]|nr:hypothetical protein IW262DRAFT_1301741 [Armillaria fumosa]
MVEKLFKDNVYKTKAVWNFLHAHHDAINPLIFPAKIPAMIIMSMTAWIIWIEDREESPGRQAWNIWIAHSTWILHFHLEWIAALESAFPIRTNDEENGEAHVLRVPFFGKDYSRASVATQAGHSWQTPHDGGGSSSLNGGEGNINSQKMTLMD